MAFFEKQRYSKTITEIGVVVSILLLIGLLSTFSCLGWLAFLILASVAALVVAVTPAHGVTLLSDEHLDLKTGWCGRKRILIKDVVSNSVVQCEAWTVDGYNSVSGGILGWFMGNPCHFYHALTFFSAFSRAIGMQRSISGEQKGVLITTSKERLIVFSGRPEALNAALDEARLKAKQ